MAEAGATSPSPGSGVYVGLAVAGLFAWRGYTTAQRVERVHGRSPYGWEPTTWSIICFCTVFFGRLLLAAGASRAARYVSPSTAQPAWAPQQSGWEPPPAPAAVTVQEPPPAASPAVKPVATTIDILPSW